MTDQLVYRLNRVPDRHYIKFLDLIGVTLYPPTAARTAVTFWLSGPQPDVVTIAAGTQVATLRTDTSEAIVFTTAEDLPIVPSSLAHLGSMIDGKTLRDHSAALEKGTEVFCFQKVPAPGDALLLGLPEAVPSNARPPPVPGRHRRRRRRPHQPAAGLGGLDGRRLGAVRGRLGHHRRAQPRRRRRDPRSPLPRRLADRQAAGRMAPGRVTELGEGQPVYSASPNIKRPVRDHDRRHGRTRCNADLVTGEEVGISEGVPGQRFTLRRGPVVPGDEDPVLEVSGAEGWDEWTYVADFANSGPDDHHFSLDLSSGEVRLRTRRAPGRRRPARLWRRAAQGRATSGSASTASAAAGAATCPRARSAS